MLTMYILVKQRTGVQSSHMHKQSAVDSCQYRSLEVDSPKHLVSPSGLRLTILHSLELRSILDKLPDNLLFPTARSQRKPCV